MYPSKTKIIYLLSTYKQLNATENKSLWKYNAYLNVSFSYDFYSIKFGRGLNNI